jgi:hypothetical protein
MDKNRITGLPDRTSEQVIAKSATIKVGVVNPAGVRRRRSILPREACAAVPATGLRGSQGARIATQESAEGIVAGQPAKA